MRSHIDGRYANGPDLTTKSSAGDVRTGPLLRPNAKGRGAKAAREGWLLAANETRPFPPPLELWRMRPDGRPGP